MSQNGYQSNGVAPGEPAPSTLHSLLQAVAPATPPPRQTDAFGNDLASSQDSDDEGATKKYASPKKKRVRNGRPSSSRKKKAAAADRAESPSSTTGPTKSSAKSRSAAKSRSRGKKTKSPPVSTFQFGKKKKKRAGSDDEGDDVDATPPPSPRARHAPPVDPAAAAAVEQDFDGNYIEKRRSTRVTKRRKYVDDDGDLTDPEDLLPGSSGGPAEGRLQSVARDGDGSQSSDAPQYEATMAEPVEPMKSYFVVRNLLFLL